MNFIAICLHCLDMRDFHSSLRDTPWLDKLREESLFLPFGRGQSHHHGDSLNPEMTGCWTARFSDSRLTDTGFSPPVECRLPKTLLEYLKEGGYRTVPLIAHTHEFGSWAVQGGMADHWLKSEPERLGQFSQDGVENLDSWLRALELAGDKFYAHIFLRATHRPWLQEQELYRMMGWKAYLKWLYRSRRGLPCYYPHDAMLARRAALEKPDEFAALRRRGLAMADRQIEKIMKATRHLKDVTYIVYSNHGETYDHFRYNRAHGVEHRHGADFREGTSHGPLPYEVLYANMQMWRIPGRQPKVLEGMGRMIDYAPTVLELAGLRHEPMDGESMLQNFSEGVLPARDRYAEAPYEDGCLSMTRADGYKLLSTGSNMARQEHRLAVFDLNCDQREEVNIVNTPRGREVVEWAVQTHAQLKN